MAQVRQTLLILTLTCAVWKSAGGQAPKFFPDDPIQAMPSPIPVKQPVREKISDALDFLDQSMSRETRRVWPAGAINTFGEAPDSEWFTNRHARRRLTRDELQRGPGSGERPTLPFTITSGKTEGIMPGFRFTDSNGRHYFAKGDPEDYGELATAAEAIVSRFLYAIGYNTPDNEIVVISRSDIRLSGAAKVTLQRGQTRDMTWADVEDILGRINRRGDGSYRIVASRQIEGTNIGPFRFEGTRRDDPNDLVPHEDRRDLRGLYVFSAWLNQTDAKAGNTLDVIVEENGSRFIRHYLIDFGSALGSDGDRPKDARFGNEFMLPSTTQALKKILTLGLIPQPWERLRFPKAPGVGNFESQMFDPDSWTSDYPNPAFLSRLPDDDFWAAKQVMAFTDDDIRAVVDTGRYTDPRSTEYVATILAERRNRIGRTFFSKVLPLDDFRVEDDKLAFDDLAVHYGFHSPRTYRLHWFAFDNMQRTFTPIRNSNSTSLPLQAHQARLGSYFCATIESPDDLLRPVAVYIRKEATRFKVVGVERTS